MIFPQCVQCVACSPDRCALCVAVRGQTFGRLVDRNPFKTKSVVIIPRGSCWPVCASVCWGDSEVYFASVWQKWNRENTFSCYHVPDCHFAHAIALQKQNSFKWLFIHAKSEVCVYFCREELITISSYFMSLTMNDSSFFFFDKHWPPWSVLNTFTWECLFSPQRRIATHKDRRTNQLFSLILC